ncbi:uncharacterized protein LOC117317918 [Pecten maximus]|uniref:uncharacterized protein LOC117317918 n=1 Tax=Pecten maximus TaxID=6579 RepID=UPI001458FFDF|nr:uncharacterized protein LOC117317918 [Pecten maximus]
MAAVDVCDGDNLSALMCSDCETDEEVKWFCQECQLNFCDRCQAHHLRRKKSKSHSIVPMREAKYTQISESRRLCVVHPGMSIDYWCESCASVICIKCVPGRHKKHTWCAIDDFMGRTQKKIRDKTDEFREMWLKYRTAMSDDSRFSEYFTQCIARLNEDVNNQASILCQEVDKMKEDLLKEIAIFERKETLKKDKNQVGMKEDMTALNALITNTELELKCCDSASSLNVLSKRLSDQEGCFQCPEINRCHPPTLSIPEHFDQLKLVSLFGQLKYPSSTNLDEKVIYEVKAKYLKTKTTRKILALCVQDNGNIWVSFDGNRFLMLMDEYLGILKESCDTEFGVVSMSLYKNTDIVFTRFMDTCVQRLVSNGDRMMTIADLYPYYAKGVCVNNENRVLVCAVTSSTKTCKIVKMTGRGQILMEITNDAEREPLTLPYRIASVDGGELFVVDMATDDHRVICLDKQRDRLFSWSWRGEGVGSVDPLGIACDKNVCYVTDEINNRIYMFPKKNNTAVVLLDESTRQSGPRCITVDRKGCIWVGCNNGIILKIER